MALLKVGAVVPRGPRGTPSEGKVYGFELVRVAAGFRAHRAPVSPRVRGWVSFRALRALALARPWLAYDDRLDQLRAPQHPVCRAAIR